MAVIDVNELDARLYELVKGIDILDAISPVNFREEKNAFLSARFSLSPQFAYASHKVDVFLLKRQLYKLPVEKLADDDLRALYTDVIESYIDKLDQFASIGTPDFIYDCLRYYGEPSDKDIANAAFILHLPDQPDDENAPLLEAPAIAATLSEFAHAHGMAHEVLVTGNMIANALVSGTRIKVNEQARITATELGALCHHEVGVHLLTTLNARAQPLRVLSMGLPLNTTTQEGLAILCEYLSGHLTLSRLKILALRVLAVDSMIREGSFRRTFLMLHEQYGVAEDAAFVLTARVFRGGGFTKDYLYLQGFHQLLNAVEQQERVTDLLAGKTAISHLPLLSRLIDKQLLKAPERISPAMVSPAEVDPVHRFIAHAIR